MLIHKAGGRARGTHADRDEKGFTLIELLVVVAIIAILVGLLLVAITGALRKARIMECGNNLKEIGTHLTIYTHRKGRYPQGVGAAFLQTLRTEGNPPMLEDVDKLFVCPLSGLDPAPAAVSYRGPNEAVVEGKLKFNSPLACDRPENHSENEPINVLYQNGRIEQMYSDHPRYQEVLSKTSE
jgi:prepilin-type N-terminal cleavage/methylation domain-containing protein